jgi:GTP-binding protein
MLPAIALVGRPNVGKSTLFNQLTRSRDALVANLSGLTRDRKYGEGRVDEQAFIVIDTGGVTGGEEGIDAAMAEQSMQAIDEADVVLLMVDARDGLNPVDEQLLRELRQRDRSFHLVVNKIDGRDEEVALSEFHAMGVASMHGIAAAHGRGIRQMIESVLEPFPARPMTSSRTPRVTARGSPSSVDRTWASRRWSIVSSARTGSWSSTSRARPATASTSTLCATSDPTR